MKKNPLNLKSQDFLIHSISQEIENGKNNLQKAIETNRSISYWKIGNLIQRHINLNSEINNYGEYIFKNLSEKLNIGERTLYLTVQFYNNYSTIKEIKNELTWSHFKILITIKDEEKRKDYEKLIYDQKLSTRDFYTIIKEENNLNSSKSNKLKLYNPVPYSYRIVKRNNNNCIDLGFEIYSDLYKNNIADFNPDSIIEVSKISDNYSFSQKEVPRRSLYAYKAYITRIIDADTLSADIDLGFNIIINHKLRLRGINAFEISTPQGKKAKEFVESKLIKVDFIIIKTFRRDKYARYLADIFYYEGIKDINNVIKNGNFLNQELLDNNLAVKYYY